MINAVLFNFSYKYLVAAICAFLSSYRPSNVTVMETRILSYVIKYTSVGKMLYQVPLIRENNRVADIGNDHE